MIVNSIVELIGNTPMMKIPDSIHQVKNLSLYVKLEMCNPFGSIKDRVALEMLKPLIDDRGERTDLTIVENSSGNTAKALQSLCNLYGMKFHLVSALAKVREQKDILKILGASIEEVPSASDCFDPNDPNDPQFVLERRVAEHPDTFYFTSQFTNPLNPKAHRCTTGEEIVRDLGRVDYFVGGVGTAGSTSGVVARLREENPACKLVGITARRHDSIPGIRSIDELWENGIFSPKEYDSLLEISSLEAIDGLLLLARKCGLLAGPSSGANLIGAIRYLQSQPTSDVPRNAVLFACDRVDPYLSYIRERRPDIFGITGERNLLSELSEEEIATAPSLSPKDALEWITNEGPLIVDTRSGFAFRQGSLPLAMNYPLEDLKRTLMHAIPFSRRTPLLLVCQRGVYTKAIAAYLSLKGYDARSLDGGLASWSQHRFPLVRPDAELDARESDFGSRKEGDYENSVLG